MTFLCICCIFDTSCTRSTKTLTPKKETWAIEDFALYDKNNELYNYPEKERLDLDYYEEEDKNYQTKRGVKLFTPAKVALAKYDLSNFYCAVDRYPILGSLKEDQKKIESDYLKKYPDVNDAVKHTKELERSNLSLYISGHFIVKSKKLIQLNLDELGRPRDDDYMDYENYEISFRIKNDEIIQICVENQ